MYHIERALKNLRVMVVNKARVESCFAKEFKLKEIAYFTSVYFTEHHNVNAPTMRYHVDEDFLVVTFNFFQWKGTSVGASTTYHPTQEE
jgi:hypothetical protein